MNDNCKIAVVGAGVMGCDVAFTLACFGYSVILKDINDDVLNLARDRITKGFRMVKMMNKEFSMKNIEEILKQITFSLSYDNFSEVDIFIENISENWKQKRELYLRLKDVCSENTLFAVNTSCISITKLASLLPYPQNMIGMHFMNPVPLKEIVEVIKGYHTSDETIERAKGFLKSLNKKAVVVNDYPGFVANRLSHLFMNEAAFLVQDQVALPKDIDIIFKKGYGHSMGPLETADLIGLDTVVDSLEVLYHSYQDSKFKCCPLLKKMVDAGLYGRKSGEGFYKYNE